MHRKFTLALLAALGISFSSVAQCGPEPSSGTTAIAADNILNSYYPGTLSPVSGSTSITVGARDARGGAAVLAVNDLILIMQMQGADINTSNSDSYGDGVAAGGAQGYLTSNLVVGYYEYANITAISGSVLTLQSGLVNNYYTRAIGSGALQTYQVIRIPRNYNLTINSGVTVNTPYWNGATGGVVVLDAVNVMTINGSITASGLGFRGGGGKNQGGATTGNTNGTGSITLTDYRFASSASIAANGTGGSKGEGIAGTPNYIFNPATVVTTTLSVEGYVAGTAGWGSPGNAGGGGTDGAPAGNGNNTGGGGGGNGGVGGKGGSGWNGGGNNPAAIPTGGYGGAVFTQRSINRLIMGGGGGAGTGNNSDNTNEHRLSGASGGGIILLRAGSYAGTTGSLTANGAAGLGILGTGGQSDGAGGGGAGGTIVAVTRTNVANGLSGVSASAVGGAGGNSEQYFEHGPGGGGGGGVIITNGAFSSAPVTGGSNGFTRATATGNPVTNAYGATSGASGALVTLATAPSILNATFNNSACGVLPVRLLSFTAAQSGSATVLDWSVDLAVNFKGFEIQFSTDGANFVPVGEVAFKESQKNYQFTHSGSTAPVNYYRLKLIDKDGAFSYTKTLVMRTNVTTKNLVLYPQPAQGFTTVQVSALAKQKVNVQILSTSGSRVIQKQVQLAAGNNIFLIDNLGKLSAGVYTVRMNIDGKVQTAKLMVQ